MTYNAVSSQAILAKVYRDFGIDDPSWEIDAIEWIGEALEFIGAGVPMEKKEVWTDVNDHTAKLPEDLIYLTSVQVVNNAPLKDDWKTSDFPYDLDKVQDKKKWKLPRQNSITHDGIGDSSTDRVYEYGDQSTSSDSYESPKDSAPLFRDGEVESYVLNPNYIHTTFETGLILFVYKGVPTDNDGFPLVPDHVKFKEACSWYIAKKLKLRGNAQVSVDYSTANQMWNKRCTQARNQANFPDLDKYEEFLQHWTQMVNKRHFNKSNLNTIGGGDIQDARTGSGVNFNYRVTEDGEVRLLD